MPKISTFLNEDMIQNLKEIGNDSGKSISKIIAELIEIGYNIKYNKDIHAASLQDTKKQELVDKHTEYLLRILTIVQDTYLCARNENSQYEEEDASDALKTIQADITEEIDQYMNNTN
jgi:hypothetical protein